MDTLKKLISDFADGITKHLPSTLGAIIVLVVGYFAAKLTRKLLFKGLNKLDIDKKIQEKSGKDSKLEECISGIGYFTVLIFTILLALDILGIQGVLDPVKNMINKFMIMIPNLIACGLIIFAGYILAQICSAGVSMVSAPLDKYSTKAGLSENFKISAALSKLVVIIVYIPIIIAALDVLKIEAISAPARSMLTELMNAIPNILAAAIILTVSYILGKFVTGLLKEFLVSLNADALPEKLGAKSLFNEKYTFSTVVSYIVFFYILLGATVAAVEKLELSKVQNLIGDFVVFFGQITVGLIILGVGSLIANVLFSVTEGEKPSFNRQLAKFATYGLVLAMGLSAMGVAETVVNMAFGFTFGAIAVAFALAFGLGGREAAGKQLDNFFSKLTDKPSKKSD